ncbi:hypothetical protein DCC79_00985 [bacterium]|nr:MAG: hypothetical protein DCC79_00985 [bacterium]
MYEFMIEVNQPVGIEVLAEQVVRRRVEATLASRLKHRKASGTVYRPADRYDVGQKLVFPALDGASGVVTAVRAGNNPAYGKYDVIGVDIDGITREFAAGLTWEHALSQMDQDLDADVLAERYAPVIAPQLAATLTREPDWLSLGDRWSLRSLLPQVNAGHLNLAEAVIMLAGEPLPAEHLLKDLDLDDSVPLETRALALELSLQADSRFRNVGAVEAPLWALTAPV